MKFSIDKVELQNAVSKAAFGLPKKAFNPIFQNFVFEIENNALIISATDTVTTASVSLTNVEYTDSSYRVLFPSNELIALAKSAPEGELEFDIAPRKAVVTSNRSEWVLNLADASSYPELPVLKNVPWKPVNRQPFIEGLRAVQNAASFDFGAPGLCMVNVSNNIFRASDRARLHQMEIDYVVPDFSIPSGVVKDFLSILKTSDDEEFYVAKGTNGFAARVGNMSMIVAGLTAEFPDVTGVLLKPTLTNDIEISVDVADLLAAVRRSRITADEETKVVTLKVSKDTLQVSTKVKTGHRMVENVECLYDGGKTVAANINFVHLEEALKSSPVTNVTMTFANPEGTKLPSVRIKATESGYDAVLSQIRMDLI